MSYMRTAKGIVKNRNANIIAILYLQIAGNKVLLFLALNSKNTRDSMHSPKYALRQCNNTMATSEEISKEK